MTIHEPKKKVIIRSSKAEFLGAARQRLILLSVGFLTCYIMIAARTFDLAFIQVPTNLPYETEASRDQGHTVPPTWRADIVDRNNVILARSLKTSSVYADPKLIINPEETAKDLMRIFSDLSYDSVLEKLTKPARFVWIKRHIQPKDKYEILKIGQPGLGFKDEYRRVYPQGSLTSHITGFANIDGKGLLGIERSFNEQLGIHTEPLKLTLDIRLQHLLHRETSRAIDEFMAKGGAGVIIDMKTNEVQAAISLPDFDPHYPGNAPKEYLFNRLTQGVYELGSAFKIFSTAAYLDHKTNDLSTKFDARKPLKRGRFSISDYHPEKRFLTIPEVFMHSSNIGSALMAEEVGTDTIRNVYYDLGLFSPLPIAIKESGSPLIPQPWRDINTLTASYGHGIAVTPLQMVNAAISLLGDGTFKTPIFAKTSDTQNTDSYRLSGDKIVSQKTSHILRDLMRLVVTDGTGEKASVIGYDVGGKTGTAEKISSNGYDRSRLISSFLGMFPMSDPQFAVFIMVDEPKGTQSSFGYATGGWVAAPAVGRVISGMTSILGIPPYTAENKSGKLLSAPDKQMSSSTKNKKKEAQLVSY